MLLLGIVYSYSLFRITIENDMQIEKFASGIPYMISLFMFAMFMAVGGVLYSKYNTVFIAIIGLVFLVLGLLLSSFAMNIIVLSISYGVILGIGVGILYGLPLRIIVQLESHNIGFLTGIVLLGFGLSPVAVSPLIGNLLANQGLQNTFIYLAIGYLLFATPFVLLLAKRDRLIKSVQSINFKIFRNKQYRSLYILFLLGTFIGLTYIGFTGSFAKDLVLIEEATIPLLISLFAIFNGLGRPMFGHLHDQIGFRKTAVISFITIIVSSIMMFFGYHLVPIFIISFMIFYINFGGWLSLTPATTIQLFGKENYSRNYGLMYTAYGFGAIFGNAISGVLADVLELKYIFILLALVAMLGVFIVTHQFREQKED